jgi:hypothetical protein
MIRCSSPDVWLYFCVDLRYRGLEARRAERDAACPSQADDDALTGRRRSGKEVTGWVFAAEAPMAMRMGPLGEVHSLSAARDRTRRMTSP